VTRLKTVLPTKKTPSKRPKIGQFAGLSKKRRQEIGILLRKARLTNEQDFGGIANVTGMSPAQVVNNERGKFGALQDPVILAHIVAVGLSPREVGV